ncbi:hypothetical protein [Maritimibacter sp. DP1N21-5]|uniref:hypothetical protein n=1 Tax=Maritimibacter sp. DP1N21-5 TaxID=2836867 RepID=UPI001C467893|nr:hypothetical protein [Maritimibacter sp. DP1N21-5]MBV7407764.1 hypothetical protein [Maritimibacter sp. DP1N21-5]
MTPETYDYTLTTAKGSTLGGLFAVAALGLGYMAVSHDGSLRILWVDLGQVGTTAFLAALALVAAALGADQLRLILRPGAVNAPIRLDTEAIVAPARCDDPALLRLTYKGISEIKPRTMAGDRVLEIRHIEGNLYISGTAMESREAFDRLWRSLEARVGLHRGYRY